MMAAAIYRDALLLRQHDRGWFTSPLKTSSLRGKHSYRQSNGRLAGTPLPGRVTSSDQDGGLGAHQFYCSFTQLPPQYDTVAPGMGKEEDPGTPG